MTAALLASGTYRRALLGHAAEHLDGALAPTADRHGDMLVLDLDALREAFLMLAALLAPAAPIPGVVVEPRDWRTCCRATEDGVLHRCGRCVLCQRDLAIEQAADDRPWREQLRLRREQGSEWTGWHTVDEALLLLVEWREHGRAEVGASSVGGSLERAAVHGPPRTAEEARDRAAAWAATGTYERAKDGRLRWRPTPWTERVEVHTAAPAGRPDGAATRAAGAMAEVGRAVRWACSDELVRRGLDVRTAEAALLARLVGIPQETVVRRRGPRRKGDDSPRTVRRLVRIPADVEALAEAVERSPKVLARMIGDLRLRVLADLAARGLVSVGRRAPAHVVEAVEARRRELAARRGARRRVAA